MIPIIHVKSRSAQLLRILPMIVLTLLVMTQIAMAQEKTQDAAQNFTAQKEGTMNPLNNEEIRVIRDKGTERPFSGEYWNNTAAGTYQCRQCGADLYRSTDKFDSRCGWPSFDDAVPNAVSRVPDADGRRTEILCTACGGHLGHVFEGEGITDKNTRHCVNSVSMVFVPEQSQNAPLAAEPLAEAVFAGGCFWGVEDAFSKVEGVHTVISGYTGGKMPQPTYADVCTGKTGHAEAVRISYDSSKVSYESLARLFFEIHNPGELNRQGPDTGAQYRSAIFYANAEQKATAEKLIAQLEKNGYSVVTTLESAGTFYEAEPEHQDFTARTGRGACHMRVPRFDRKAQ